MTMALLGTACLIVFVLAGRVLMQRVPPKNSADWLVVVLCSGLVIGSVLPLVLLDFSQANARASHAKCQPGLRCHHLHAPGR